MRKKSIGLTPAEIRLMEILWEKKKASVAEITEELASQNSVAYTTVLTMLRIMEQKGYVSHTKQGRAFIYRPLIDRQRARRSAIRHIIGSLFNDSPELLMLNILEHEKVSAEELKRLKDAINQFEE